MEQATGVVRANRLVAELIGEHSMVAPEVLAALLRQANNTRTALTTVLAEAGFAPGPVLLQSIAEHVGIEYWGGDTSTISDAAIASLPQDVAWKLDAAPVRIVGERLTVAVADPFNLEKHKQLSDATGREVDLALTRSDRIASVLNEVYQTPVMAHGESGTLRIDALLDELVANGGSDLHLTAGSAPRVRVDGELRPLPGHPVMSAEELHSVVFEMLNTKSAAMLENDWELDMSRPVPGLGRFRTSVFYQRGALGAVFRAVPTEITDLESLGIPASVEEFAHLSRGLVLVTGPTGSGKTTTLASVVDVINATRSAHIMTIEDPIEFVHRHKQALINQREVGSDTKAFATALRQALRQDPDVILVGEMRDLETISATVTAAETGHLVFATLHTANAPQSVDRIIDVFPAHQQQQIRMQLASSIQGIVSQQLVPKLQGGRAAAVEVMVGTSAIRAMIRDAKVHQIHSAMQAGARFGMQTMDAALAALVKNGVIAPEVGIERCHDSAGYEALMRGSAL